jgi:hypothetical protein
VSSTFLRKLPPVKMPPSQARKTGAEKGLGTGEDSPEAPELWARGVLTVRNARGGGLNLENRRLARSEYTEEGDKDPLFTSRKVLDERHYQFLKTSLDENLPAFDVCGGKVIRVLKSNGDGLLNLLDLLTDTTLGSEAARNSRTNVVAQVVANGHAGCLHHYSGQISVLMNVVNVARLVATGR